MAFVGRTDVKDPGGTARPMGTVTRRRERLVRRGRQFRDHPSR